MSAPQKSSVKRVISAEDKILLIGLPIIVAVGLIGWAVWRNTAELGAVEERQLAWGTVLELTRQHLLLVAICAVIVLVLAIPAGILFTRPKLQLLAPIVTGIANAGQSAPVIGVIVLLAMWIAFGIPVAVLSLSLYAFLPVLANTIAGLRGVDPALIESARGMGMTNWQVLRQVELPLALPIIMTGVRTALVLLAGTASFATFIDAGGLGALIQTGITLYRFRILVSGALLIALLALVVEWLGRLAEVYLKPKGLE